MGKIFSTHVHACKKCHFLLFWLNYFESSLGRVWETKPQAIPGFPLGSPGKPWVPGLLWDIKSWVGSSWSSVSSSVHAGIHQHVCHPIWSSFLSRCTSLLHSPCPCSKASSGASYLHITFLLIWWMGDIILFPVILKTWNCYRSLCGDRTSYIIGRTEWNTSPFFKNYYAFQEGNRRPLNTVWDTVWLHKSLTQ